MRVIRNFAEAVKKGWVQTKEISRRRINSLKNGIEVACHCLKEVILYLQKATSSGDELARSQFNLAKFVTLRHVKFGATKFFFG